MIRIDGGKEYQGDELVLFSFDEACFPYKSGLELSMVEGKRTPGAPVIARGPAGAPDCNTVAYYGTVLQIDGIYRMWYLGGSDLDSGRHVSWYRTSTLRICYAVSEDGIHWEKPDLGIVDFNGNRKNNLVDLSVDGTLLAFVILYEPDDPDPARRFKMSYETLPKAMHNVAFSPDGLHWTNAPQNPVMRTSLEQTGLIRRDGLYHVVGQGASQVRLLDVHSSADFLTWSDACVIGFRRDSLGRFQPRPVGQNVGEQVHVGASLWDRGNVVLGVYGQWHGGVSGNDDRRFIAIDLGLLVTHDCLHYSEPLPDFGFIQARELAWPAAEPGPRITQGQGFMNIGDRTLIWYGTWGPGGGDGVHLATWERDRFGYLSVLTEARTGTKRVPGLSPHAVSAPVTTDGREHHLSLNAVTSANGHLRVELLDLGFRPLPGFSGEQAAVVDSSGLDIHVRFESGALPKDSTFRFRFSFEGVRPEDPRVYSCHVR